ncbi:hypothetical protein MMC27_001423 [Xylographa pallens]|nr:hypothetical protein [Xylographa pallens]
MSSSRAMEKTASIFYDASARYNPFQNLKNAMQNLSVGEQTSVLCLLPYDIRTMIYRLVLCSENVLAVEPKVPTQNYALQPDLVKLGTKGVSCGLLRTCRLFYREAAYLLYSTNTFSLGGHNLPSFLYGLLNTVRLPNTAAIRTLSIYFNKERLAHLAYDIADDVNPLLRVLERLPGLQELLVKRPYDDFKLAYSCRNSPDARLDTYREDSRLWTYRLLTAALQDVRDGLSIEQFSTCHLFLDSKNEYVRLVLNERAPIMQMKEVEVWPVKNSKLQVEEAFSQLEAALGGRSSFQVLVDRVDEMRRKSILDRSIWDPPGGRIAN